MVRKKHAVALTISLSFAGILNVCPAVRAQGVLEQMENEVATIAAQTKRAVVTISDRAPRAAAASPASGAASGLGYRVERVTEIDEATAKREAADAAAIKALSVAYFNLDVEETGARAELKELRKKYVETHPAVIAQQEKIKAVQTQRDAALKKLSEKKAAVKASQAPQYRVFRNPNTAASAPGATRSGTGFSIGDGYIVTTADVLDGMKDPLVTTDSGIQARAQIVGVNKEWNVGLLKLAAKVDLPALTLGDSAKVAVGHFALSVGEQSGQSNSVALLLVGGLRTDGVSAGGHFYPNLIQIAGTVGAGISGAPLVNSRGEVIGIMAGVPAAPQNLSFDNTGAIYNTAPPALSASISPFFNTAGAAGNQPYVLYPRLAAGEHWDALSGAYVIYPVLGRGEYLDSIPTLGVPNQGGAALPDAPNLRFNYETPTVQWNDGLKGSGARSWKLTPGAAPKKDVPKKAAPKQNAPKKDALKKDDSKQKNATAAGRIPYVATTYGPIGQVYNEWNLPALGSPAAAPVSSAGFAVPINALKPILEELKSGRRVAQGWIGLSPRDDVTTTETGGIVTVTRRVIVDGVYPGSPAFIAKIRPGDVVISINGKPIQSANDVREVSQGLRPGDKATFRYLPKALADLRDASGERDAELVILERPTVYAEPIVLPKDKD